MERLALLIRIPESPVSNPVQKTAVKNEVYGSINNSLYGHICMVL
jgi:hypothetical protein